jgi:tetratricopeptide (TPR) repeat protein
MLLDEQLKTNPVYHKYINDHYVPISLNIRDVKFSRGESYDEPYNLKRKFNMFSGMLILDSEGAEIDRISHIELSEAEPEYVLFLLENVKNNINTPAHYKAILDKDPGNLDAYFQTALKISLDHHDYKTGAEMFRKIIERADEAKLKTVPFHNSCSNAEVNMLEYAEYCYAQDLTSDIESFKVDENRAKHLIDFVYKYPESRFAEEIYQSTIRIVGWPQESIQMESYFKNVLDRYPHDPMAVHMYGYYCATYDYNVNHAIQTFENLISNSTRPISQYIHEYKKLLELKGNLSRMEETYGPKYIKFFKNDWIIQYRYARFWAEEGKNLESALDAAKNAVKLKDNFSTNFALSTVYLRLEDYENALEAINIAIKQGPKYRHLTEQKENILKAMEK